MPADPWDHEAATRLPTLLEDWLSEPVELSRDVLRDGVRIDLIATTPTRTILIEVKGSDGIAGLQDAAARLRRATRCGDELPLLVVPYMGPRAQAWAQRERVSWADLSGNADIRAVNLRVRVAGAENRYAHSGRPGNPFAPRYARVSRALLAEPDRWWRQRDLCDACGLSDATVSRAVGHLRTQALLDVNERAELRARAPTLLLDAWAQRYVFADHRLHRFHMVARSGSAALRTLAEKLEARGCTWAATGLAGAWLWTQHADFRLTTLYVDELPRDVESLGLHPAERGENVWLVVPVDEGVFYKRSEQGVWCAHPVQVYLDLLSQPERAAEAAAQLRANLLTWRA